MTTKRDREKERDTHRKSSKRDRDVFVGVNGQQIMQTKREGGEGQREREEGGDREKASGRGERSGGGGGRERGKERDKSIYIDTF